MCLALFRELGGAIGVFEAERGIDFGTLKCLYQL